jgi:hypothetical protein
LNFSFFIQDIPDSPKSTKGTTPARVDSAQENKSSNSPRKTSWNQQRPAKSTTNLSTKKSSNSDSSSLNGSIGNSNQRNASAKSTSSNHETQTSKDSTRGSSQTTNGLITNDNKLNELLTTQPKIPYPPPQSTRPLSSRKILRSGVKNPVNNNQPIKPNPIESNQNANKLTETKKTSQDEHMYSNNVDTSQSNNSNNNFNYVNLDESINDIIQVLRSNGNNNSKPSTFSTNSDGVVNLPKASSNTNLNYNEMTNLDDSSRTIVYTFASKPKPVTASKDSNNNSAGSSNLNNSANNVNTNSNTSKAEYDFRKYSSANNSNISSKQNIQQLESVAPSNSGSKTPAHFYDAIVKDSLNVAENNLNEHVTHNEVMDSFEAQMLQEMKAEMDANTGNKNAAKNTSGGSRASKTSNVSKASGNSKTANYDSGLSSGMSAASAQKPTSININYTNNMTKANALMTNEPNLKLLPTSPDIGYLEDALQRESSGLQSPLSDRTTSEKYNFDAMTSSIEDTTTSLSKKTVKI